MSNIHNQMNQNNSMNQMNQNNPMNLMNQINHMNQMNHMNHMNQMNQTPMHPNMSLIQFMNMNNIPLSAMPALMNMYPNMNQQMFQHDYYPYMQFPFKSQGLVKLGVTNDLGNVTKQMLDKFKVKSNKGGCKNKGTKMDFSSLKV